MKKAVALILMLALVVSLGACAGNPGTTSSAGSSAASGASGASGAASTAEPGTSAGAPETPAGGPQYGGLLRLVISGDTNQPFGLPWEMALRTMDLLTPYGETLILETVTGDLEPWLAESWEVDLENLEIRFKLREGILFSDGSELTAEIVAWQCLLAIETRTMNQAVVDVEVRGKYELAMILNSYINSTLTHFSSHVATMVSKEHYDKNGNTYAMENPVGTGPFILKERVPGSKVSFSRNDNYWIEGKPYLDEVEFVAMTDIMTQNAAMESTGEGGVDVLRSSIGEQVATLSNIPHLTTKAFPSGTTVLAPSSRDENSPLAKLEVRQAISLAIDREAICAARGFGVLYPSYQMFPRGFKGYIPELDHENYANPYDPAAAKELLSQAGYPDGFTVPMHIPSSIDRDAAVAIQDMLSAVGITCEMNFPESGAATELRLNGWDGLLGQGLGAMTNTSSIIRLNLDPYYDYLPSAWRPVEELDPKFIAARATLELEDGLMQELQRMYVDNMIVIPLYSSNSMVFFKDNVFDTGFGDYGNLSTIWTPWNAWKS